MKRLLPITILLMLGLMPARAQNPDTLATVVVTAVKEKMKNTTQTGLVRLDSTFLKRGAVSFGTPDVIKTLLTLPGVSAGNELMGGMYVHGGDGTDNLYLLDGVPLYNISHFGGIFSSFNTDMVSGLDFYKSGFPARYGTKLSSVVDVSTSDGNADAFHGSLSLGLIDGRIHFEGPIVKGKTSFNFGYRRSWMDMMIWLAMKINGDDGSRRAAYFMHDLNAGVTHRFRKDNVLRVNFFWGKDDLDMGLSQNGMSLDMAARWGNLSGSANWSNKINSRFKYNLTAYYTQSVSATDYSIQATSGGLADLVDSGIRDLGARYGLDWYPSDEHHLRAGLDYSFKMYGYKGQSEDPTNPSAKSPELDFRSHEASVYVEDEFFITHNFTLNAGLRNTLYGGKKAWNSLEPRAAIKWAPVHFMDVKLSYSRMSQGDHLVASSYLDLPSNTWMPSTERIRPVFSDQVSGGFYLKPVQGMTLNIEGWYKTMEHLLYYVGPNSMFPPVQNWESSFAEGRGVSYGLETELGWKNEKLSATAYYTLSWSKRFFEEVYPGWFYANNDNRHKINLLFSWRINRALELYANWNYHTGNRVTFPSNVTPEGIYLYSEANNFTLPDYHRLDLGLNWVHRLRKGQRLELNASIYNAYNNKNAFFAYIKRSASGSFDGVAYSVLPFLPSFSLTYGF